jgi:uncharacterized protein YdbL (DUF1318 family)
MLLLGILLVPGLSGCMTLNVNMNFPDSAVQKATDDYVRDLYRAKTKPHDTENADPAKTTPEKPSAWNFIPKAYADDSIGFKVNTPKSLEIRNHMAARIQDVLQLKRSGVLGETNDGLLKIKKVSKLKKLQDKAESIVSAENQDRTELYQEVLSANGLSEARMPSVRASFARSFQSESPSGTWVQGTDGSWSQKR